MDKSRRQAVSIPISPESRRRSMPCTDPLCDDYGVEHGPPGHIGSPQWWSEERQRMSELAHGRRRPPRSPGVGFFGAVGLVLFMAVWLWWVIANVRHILP